MKNLIPLLSAVLITLFIFISCDNSTDTPANNNTNTGNNAPETPKNPSPADNATNVPRISTLSWTCTDPDAGDSVKFDLWMANVNPPDHSIVTGLTTASYSIPYLLAADTVFYWKIIAKDKNNNVTTGPVWRFFTGATQ